MAFVVPGVCRFAINQRFDNRAVVNVLDVRIDTTGSPMSREAAIADQAAVILDNWALNVQNIQSHLLSFESVTWVDLDEADGSTGSVTSGPTVNLPTNGDLITDSLPSNTSALIVKEIEGGRGRRDGHMYLAGLVEAQTTNAAPNQLSSTAGAAIQAELTDFFNAVNQDGVSIGDYDSRICVVHILTREAPTVPGRPGAPLTGDSRDVESLNLVLRLATQRRRLRG